MQKNNRKKRNNKGFSMVELIIVIAIMAALVGILAPQYIKYVNKSRLAAENTAADELIKAAQVVVSDPDAGITSVTITYVAAGTISVTAKTPTTATVPTGLVPASGPAFKSTEHKDKTSFTVTASSDGSVSSAWNS